MVAPNYPPLHMADTSAAFAPFGRKKLIAIAIAAVLIVLSTAGYFFWRSTIVSGMDFSLRQKVAAQSDLHFSFPERMDRASVEESLTSMEGLKGDWRWEDEVRVFDPVESLKASATYTFMLPAASKTAEGDRLGRDLAFVFTVAGPPKAAARIPVPGSTMIGKDSKITIVFDRPMIPLSQVQGEFAKDAMYEWPVAISPAVKGRWRWLSTVAREFIPEKSLTEGTKYTVTVPKGIASVAGDKTEEEFTWSFETARPEVVVTEPAEGSALAGPATVLTLVFNREVDVKSAAASISLHKEDRPTQSSSVAQAKSVASSVNNTSVPKGAREAIREVVYGTREEDGKKVTDKTQLIVRPVSPLSYNAAYAIHVAPGLKGIEGDLGTQSGYTLRFSTVGDLTVASGRYAETEEEVQINFSNPLDGDTLKDNITITPAPENMTEFEWAAYEWTEYREVRGHPTLKPSTTYTVTVGKGVKDQNGQSLKEPFTFTFTTPKTAPRAFIHSKGEFGIFEKGKPPVYYLNAVNVSKLDVSFAKLSLAEFLQQRSGSRVEQTTLSLAGKEGYRTWQLQTKQKLNEWEVVTFDPEKRIGSKLAPGIYALQLAAPEYVQPWDPAKKGIETQIFAITNLSVTLKYSGDSMLVWVTDMQTGNPVKDARITLHALDGRTPLSGKTDKDGFFESVYSIKDFATTNNDWEPEFWVTAETDDDLAFVSSSWNDGIRPYNFGFSGDFRAAQAGAYRLDSYVYTERPIYKAGDTVQFKGIVRLRDWSGEFAVPADRQARVLVYDAQGNEVFNKSLKISPFGSFSGALVIDQKATLGNYSLSVSLTPEEEIWNNYAGSTFAVLAYRKPEYQVEIVPEREDYFHGEKASALVTGSYYFGAPMGNATVAWRAQTTDYFFNKVTDGWYSFSTGDSWCWQGCERKTEMIAQGSGRLDASGRMIVDVPLSLEGKDLSQVLTIEADITDQNNQVVSNRASVYVHKADAYVGIKTQEYVVTPGEESTVDLLTVKPDGSPLGSQSVTLQLFSRTWNSIRKKGVDGEYYYDNEPKDTFVRESKVTTDAKGKATASIRIPDGGEYRIVAAVRDKEKREAKAATSVYAWSSSYFNWPRTNSDRMEVQADKPEYKPGETASILVKSPYQGKGVKALVTVEREGIISRRVVDITSNAQSIEIPVTEALIPNAYVSVVVVKARQGETFNEYGLDTGAPAFKVGYAKLTVDASSKRLQVTVKPDKAQYAPGETVNVAIRTTDATGKGMQAEVSLGTVDMSLLALSSFETPDLTRLFYAERGLGMYTSQMLTFLLERFKPGSKGGGGSTPEAKARGNFRDTAYWNPSIVTNAAGEASISFRLPDNLTTWQLLAVGSSKDHRFGSDAVTILETKKVIVRPVRPRFAVQGDRIELGAIVHNFLPKTSTYTVSLTGSGFAAAGETTKQVTIESGKQVKLTFPVVAGTLPFLVIRLKAQTEGAIDEIVESIPVYEYSALQSVATTGMTESVAQEKVIAPSENDASEGTLSIAVSPTLAVYLPKALDYLATYPYGCTEQTLSSFLPAVALLRLNAAGNIGVTDRNALEKTVTAGLERMYAFQRADGGFGYWETSERSYAPLSAYVLYGLQITEDAGFSVDAGVIDRLVAYLNEVLRGKNDRDVPDLTTRAAILYALSEAGRMDLSLLNNLNQDRDKLPVFAQAQLALAYENVKSGSSEARAIVRELVNRARVDSRGTHFEEEDASLWGDFMNTTDKTTAIVLESLLKIDPENALIPNITRYMLTSRKDGHWDTTQSTVHALLAFAEYLEQTGETNAAFGAGVEVNGKRVVDWIVKKGNAVDLKESSMPLNALKRGEENDVKIGLNGKGRLYYDLLLSYLFTGDEIAPAEEGIGISREVKPLSAKDRSTAREFKVGGTYVVTLTVTVPEERRFVAVESPVPAGMEVIDLMLETSQKSLLSEVDDATKSWDRSYWESGLWRFSHREVRDDRFFLFAETLPAGVYQYHYIVRATTPGVYRERPARAFEMYFPEVFGQTAGMVVIIKE